MIKWSFGDATLVTEILFLVLCYTLLGFSIEIPDDAQIKN